MKKDKHKTKVQFYVASYEPNEHGEIYEEILAVFIDEEENDRFGVGKCYSCYAHFGQHSTCSQSFLAEKARKATENEYKDLFNELTNSVGYNLEVI